MGWLGGSMGKDSFGNCLLRSLNPCHRCAPNHLSLFCVLVLKTFFLTNSQVQIFILKQFFHICTCLPFIKDKNQVCTPWGDSAYLFSHK